MYHCNSSKIEFYRNRKEYNYDNYDDFKGYSNEIEKPKVIEPEDTKENNFFMKLFKRK